MIREIRVAKKSDVCAGCKKEFSAGTHVVFDASSAREMWLAECCWTEDTVRTVFYLGRTV